MFVKISNHSKSGQSWQRWHICRPERFNAIGTTIAQELSNALERLRNENLMGVRAIVLTAESVERAGSRSKIWIAGGDLKELAVLKDPKEGKAYARMMRQFCEGLEYLPIPVVSLVDGHAIGGGAEVAMAADIRLATQESAFEFKQLKMGLATGYGSSQKMLQLVGKSRAQSWLYFAESVTAADALACGLIQRILKDMSMESIETVIEPLLMLEPKAFAAQKRMLQLASQMPSANNAWADELFEAIWFNDTHKQNLLKY